MEELKLHTSSVADLRSDVQSLNISTRLSGPRLGVSVCRLGCLAFLLQLLILRMAVTVKAPALGGHGSCVKLILRRIDMVLLLQGWGVHHVIKLKGTQTAAFLSLSLCPWTLQSCCRARGEET